MQDCKIDKKKLMETLLYEKPSDCKYCEPISAGVMGLHCACAKHKYSPPLCKCDDYEKEN